MVPVEREFSLFSLSWGDEGTEEERVGTTGAQNIKQPSLDTSYASGKR